MLLVLPKRWTKELGRCAQGLPANISSSNRPEQELRFGVHSQWTGAGVSGSAHGHGSHQPMDGFARGDWSQYLVLDRSNVLWVLQLELPRTYRHGRGKQIRSHDMQCEWFPGLKHTHIQIFLNCRRNACQYTVIQLELVDGMTKTVVMVRVTSAKWEKVQIFHNRLYILPMHSEDDLYWISFRTAKDPSILCLEFNWRSVVEIQFNLFFVFLQLRHLIVL